MLEYFNYFVKGNSTLAKDRHL